MSEVSDAKRTALSPGTQHIDIYQRIAETTQAVRSAVTVDTTSGVHAAIAR